MSSLARALSCGVAWLLMAAGAGAQPTASEPELDADEALFRLGRDQERPPAEAPADSWTFGARLGFALTASGGEPRTHLAYDSVVRPRLGSVFDFHPDQLLQPMASRAYPSARLSLSAEWEAASWLLLRGLFDSGQVRQGSTLELPLPGIALDGSPALDALRQVDFVRELSVVLGERALTVELGRFRTGLANGLVYEGFGLGARADLRLDSVGVLPLRAELSALSLTDRLAQFTHTPLIALRLEYPLSLFESLGVFGALVWDRNGSMSDVLRAALAERILERPLALNALFANERGRGDVLYVGADAAWSVFDGALLRAAAVLATGQFDVWVGGAFGGQERKVALALLAAAADAELRYDLGRGFEVVGYAFVLSGDGPPKQGATYHAFISPAPYWVWTGLFFSGGLNQGLFADRAALGGIDGHGVLGAGPGLSWSDSALSCDMRAVWLQALAASPSGYGGGGTSYGLELDVRAQWRFWNYLGLGAELDGLLPADYFPRQRVAYRALALLSVDYEH